MMISKFYFKQKRPLMGSKLGGFGGLHAMGYIGGNGGLPEMGGSLGTMKVYFTLIA